MEPFSLKTWQLHTSSAKLSTAEKTLKGTAHPGGLKFCGPYTYANKCGFWLYSPIDIDILWKGGKEFDVRWHQEYDDFDYHLLRRLLLPSDNITPDMWCIEGGRNKFTWGMVEDGVVQYWTGLIFQTPPGWCLHIRSPINYHPKPFFIMEGILETDWMHQDIWMNMVFTQKNEWVEFRREGLPLAHLVPIRRESFSEDWQTTNEMVNRDSPEANRIFEYWIQFNEKKFGKGGKQALLPDMSRTKDSGTFYKEKARCIGQGMEPKEVVVKECPFHKAKNKVVVYCINDSEKYMDMALNSISMLRKYNETIPITLIFVEGEIEERSEEFHSFYRKLRDLKVNFVSKPYFRHETNYFSINKHYLKDLQEDSVLYLDVDTFINGDVEVLFDKYRADMTVIESEWAYFRGWTDDLLPNKGKPVNSGIQLFHNYFHQKLFSGLSEAFDKLSNHDNPLANWSWSYYNGCLREELACALILAESGASYMFFQPQDCYNIQRVEDIPRCHEPIIFHSYTRQWDMVKRWCRLNRRVLFKKKDKSCQ